MPAFLPEIATLQVFFGVVCSYIGWLKSCVDTFGICIKLWYPLSELCIWCIRNDKFISLKCFPTLIEKSLGWILWSGAPHLGSIGPCFLLPLTFSGLPCGSCSLSILPLSTGDSPPSRVPRAGSGGTALAELIRAPAVTAQQGKVCESCFVLHMKQGNSWFSASRDGGCFS